MDIRISAVICTHNRSGYLRLAIESLIDQTLPAGSYEILVVDNGSTDDTRQVVDGFASWPNLCYIYEPVLGLSQARNTALQQARGQYIAYLDDDATAHRQWLAKIVAVLDTVEPQPGCVGGRVYPIWEVPRPPWLSDRLVRSLAVVDWSDVPTVLPAEQWLAGVNVAFPRHVLEHLGGFQTALGRKGKRLISMEESLLQQRIEALGYARFYHPEIAVDHHIQAERLTKDWFRRRAYWQGVSQAAAWMLQAEGSAAERFRRLVRATGGLLLSPGRLANLVLPSDDPERFTAQYGTLVRFGYILGLLGLGM